MKTACAASFYMDFSKTKEKHVPSPGKSRRGVFTPQHPQL